MVLARFAPAAALPVLPVLPVFLVVVSSVALADERHLRFSVTPLSTTDFSQPQVKVINDKGSAAGYFGRLVNDSYTHLEAFFQDRDGVRRPLANFPGDPPFTLPFDINKHDWVVGLSQMGTHDRAAAWTPDGDIIDLGVLPGGSSSQARAINSLNQVVGFSQTDSVARAFVWERGEGMRELDAPAGIYTHALALNDKGTVVGNAYLNGPERPNVVMWTPDGEFRDLGHLPDRFHDTAAVAVNNMDHLVGGSHHEDGHHALFWSEQTGMRDLGRLPGMKHSSAVDINDDDWVVGTSRNPGTTAAGHAFLWTPQWGMLDLNNLLDEQSRNWVVHEASWVGEKGDVLAVATLDGQYHVVLLNAHTPEPGAAALMIGGAGLLLRRTRRRG